MSDPLAHETNYVTDAAVLRAVERAIGELRRGEPVVLTEAGGGALMLAAEQVDDAGLARLRHLGEGASPLLVITARRAAALGLPPAGPGGGPVALAAGGAGAARILALADPTGGAEPLAANDLPAPVAAGPSAGAAIDLAKLARLLPAALLSPVALGGQAAAEWARARDLLTLDAAQIAEYRFAGARSLTRVTAARLPLAGAEDAQVIAFRPGDGGGEHFALVIGEPKPGGPVLVRLHSECFTGDLLRSLRCDCGDQLRGAIEAIAEAGAGILLYLSQEGRGIGLVNKLRAYRLQDGGADTAEANEQLGFDADERIYLPAASMLRQLGVRRVRLLTNNPQKVAALGRCGITVEERVPHAFPSNGHNAFYLATKAARFGHQF
jgi:GTP cyclohydrolase II